MSAEHARGGRRVRPCGDTALLVEVDDLPEVLGLHAALAAASPAGVVDLVPAARTLLVTLDRGVTTPADVARVLRDLPLLVPDAAQRPVVDVPVLYDGDDLGEVARLTGLDADEVVRAHTGQTWTVGFVGFAPGFGYLTGEDDRLHVPRRSDPRTRVPAGAVGLAGEFSGIYPRESPGGWQLIGRTSLEVWDLDREPPALLQPGTRVRFAAAG